MSLDSLGREKSRSITAEDRARCREGHVGPFTPINWSNLLGGKFTCENCGERCYKRMTKEEFEKEEQAYKEGQDA